MATKKMNARPKKKKKAKELTTIVGALSPTGPGAKLSENGGGKVYKVNHRA